MRRQVLLLAAAFPWPLLAQGARDSVITLTANRSTRIAPDRASLYLIVEGTAETSADAIARVRTKVKAITDALNGFGSRVKLDAAVSYGVGPTTNPAGYPGLASPATSTSRSVFRVQVDRLDQLAAVMSAALAAGAASTSSLTFDSSVADSVRRVRIGEAIGAARLDAEAVAQSLGGRLGALMSVNTANSAPYQGPSFFNFDARVSQQQAPVPDIPITANVTVQFRLVR